MRTRGLRLARTLCLVAWVAVTVLAVAAAVLAVARLSGVTDRTRVEVDLPLVGDVSFGVTPTWAVATSVPLCRTIDVDRPDPSCLGFRFTADSVGSGSVVTSGGLRAVRADLDGVVVLAGGTGWDPLLASLLFMQVLSMLVLAAGLFQVWRLLRLAGAGEPFAAQAPRHLLRLGVLVVGWQVVQPLLWLVLSPKAWDWSVSQYGPGPDLTLGSMEGGGPSVAWIASGLLMLLLAEVFRHGAAIADEQRLTV